MLCYFKEFELELAHRSFPEQLFMFTQSDDNGLLRGHTVHVLMAVIIFSSSSPAPRCQCLPGQTDKPAAQQGSWITVKNLSGLPASLPSREGDSSYFSNRLSLSLVDLKWFRLPIFSGMAKTQTTCKNTHISCFTSI